MIDIGFIIAAVGAAGYLIANRNLKQIEAQEKAEQTKAIVLRRELETKERVQQEEARREASAWEKAAQKEGEKNAILINRMTVNLNFYDKVRVEYPDGKHKEAILARLEAEIDRIREGF